MLLGVKQSTNTHCLLWETGLMPLFLLVLRCPLLEQPADNLQNLIEQDQSS